MTTAKGSAARQLVPRWRDWKTTTQLSGLHAKPTTHLTSLQGTSSTKLEDYWVRPNSARAVELLAHAFALDEVTDEMREVGRLHADRTHSLASDFVNFVLQNDCSSQGVASFEPSTADETRRSIARLKVSLGRHPRNPIGWADLARCYTLLAQLGKATTAVRTAVALAPTNRFILRTATAFYVHTDQADLALDLLARAPNMSQDPWLLAPYIALTDLLHHKAKKHRVAQQMLAESDFDGRQLAELRAALGSSEINAGSERKGRQLLRKSAEQPTENSLAQVEWFSERLQMQLIDAPVEVPRDFEAKARRAAYDGKWDSAVTAGRFWLTDQPFSSDAGVFSSFCASIAEDWDAVLETSTQGLLANPHNAALLNNKAVALIELGDYVGAAQLLNSCRRSNVTSHLRPVLLITEGLLFFRLQHYAEGRQRYEMIIRRFQKTSNAGEASRAALALAREEVLAKQRSQMLQCNEQMP